MSNYEEWFKTGQELLKRAEEVTRMGDITLVSDNGKRAICFPFPYNKEEIQKVFDKFRQQLETAKQKHEAREKLHNKEAKQ